MPLWPTIPTPTSTGTTKTTAPNSAKSTLLPDWLLDFSAERLPVGSDGDIQRADGYRAWLQGWINLLLVQQNAHPIYRRTHGVDHERLMQLPTRSQIESAYRARIRNIAAREPSTREVRSVSFTWVGDSCTLAMDLVCVTGDTIPISVDLHV